MEKYRVENPEHVNLNGRPAVSFKAYKYASEQQAYIYCGQYYAPALASFDDLKKYIDE